MRPRQQADLAGDRPHLLERAAVQPGALQEPEATSRDLGVREVLAVAPIVAALVLFGFYPKPLLDAADPMVQGLLSHVGAPDDGPTVPAATGSDQ